MANTAIPVSAQWALEGKQPDGEGYRILACSTGELDKTNFADAISRFQLGELSDLPQVSMSYARLGAQSGISYLALAIHWYAEEGQRYAEGVWQRDSQGRPTAHTSYFCLPYGLLAESAIGYPAIYEALRTVTLTVTDGPPKDVPIATPASRIPAADDLAVRVAPLLLTGRQVCMLGAEDTSLQERLHFIDSVMGLLPYGYRSRMTAATWMRASNRNHRFRLFFSNAPRADEPGYVVSWGDPPNQIDVPDGGPSDYFDWLQGSVGALAKLADLKMEMSFGRKDNKDNIKAIESVLGIKHRLHFRSRPAVQVSNDRTAQPLPVLVQGGDDAEKILRDCAANAKLADPTWLYTDIDMLKRFVESGIDENRRQRYLAVIIKLGLLKQNFLVDKPGHLRRTRPDQANKHEKSLYDTLLRMSVGTPLSYSAYCLVEKCAGIDPGDAPHQELLEAIDRAGTSDPLVNAIMQCHRRERDEKKYSNWLLARQIDVIAVIRALAGDRIHQPHGRMVCNLTLDYLEGVPGKYEPQQVRDALCEHGFLARALQKRHFGNDQYQFQTLYRFLKLAYPRSADTPGPDLSSADILHILSGAGSPPTPALLSAVLMMLDSQEAYQLAWNAYIFGSITQLTGETVERLRDRIPNIGAPTISTRGRSLPSAAVPQARLE